MYWWVVQFLNYFISISEKDVETGKQDMEEIAASFYLFIAFYANNFL